jgi:hypothetical protein
VVVTTLRVMTSETRVVFGSRPVTTTRCIRSRSEKMPTIVSPSRIGIAPTRPSVMVTATSKTVASGRALISCSC